ncbi:hypothetical protein VaNZ11_007720 [Volvox africanus]|uniref:RING-type domain-containing protein n=1 Tax=Volvox africanus TaxID=51714 RepID=A0ABQ5S4L8_9CHLO|nr:hypothetical protein VaNZ11_007720 [Volvox africanus]
MGCATSCIAPAVADLRKSVKSGDVDTALRVLTSCPHLLSSPISFFSSRAVTPLHAACERKQIRTVEEILSFLASSGLPTVQRALRPYCQRICVPLPSSVVEGVQMAVQLADYKGQTPLMYGCFVDCPELVRLLLTKGADPWARDLPAGRTALHYAAMSHSAAGLKMLMQYIPRDMLSQDGCRYMDATSDCGLTALHYCVFSDNLEALRELLYSHHLDVNAATKSQSYDDHWVLEAASTPLHFAAARGSLAAAVELLRYYDQRVIEDPSIEDPRTRVDTLGQTPYQLATLVHPSHCELSALLRPNQPLRVALRTALLACGAELALGPPPLVALAAEVLRHKLLEDVRCAVASVAVAAASAPPKPEAAVHPDLLEELRMSSLINTAPARGRGPTGRPCTNRGGAEVDRSPKMFGFDSVPGALPLEEGVASCGGSRPGGSAGSGFSPSSSPDFRVVRDSAWEDDGEYQEGKEVQCGVCLELPVVVMSPSCGHGICGGCAEQLCAGIASKPLTCPFCRRSVPAFMPWERPRFKTQSFGGP